MLHSSRESSMDSHSNGIEHRLTVVETVQDERLSTNEIWKTNITARVTYVERMCQGLIWAVATLASASSSGVAEKVLALLKTKT